MQSRRALDVRASARRASMHARTARAGDQPRHGRMGAGMTDTLHDHLVRIASADVLNVQRRTQYVLKSTLADVFISSPRLDSLNQWSDVQNAQRFDSMTAAIAYATLTLDLPVEAYTVEAV